MNPLVVYLFATTSTIIIFVMAFLIFCYKKELKRTREELESTKKALAGKNRRPEDVQTEAKKPQNEIFDGLVIKKKVRDGNHFVESFSVNEDKMPEMGTVEAAVAYGRGFTDRPEDPTIMNLAGYGCVMQSDTYIAFKVIMRYIFALIAHIQKEEKNDTTEIVGHPGGDGAIGGDPDQESHTDHT